MFGKTFRVILIFWFLSLLTYNVCLSWLPQEIELSAKVNYVTTTSIYLDLGKQDGLAIDDTLIITKDNVSFARLKVTAVSENSSANEFLKKPINFSAGDQIMVSIKKKQERMEMIKEITFQPGKEQSHFSLQKNRKNQNVNKLKGYLSVQYYGISDRSENNLDFQQFAFVSDVEMKRIGGSYFDLSVHLRGRRDFGTDLDTRSGADSRPLFRFYELALKYNNPNSKIEYSFGRIRSSHLYGLGYFDGTEFVYNLNKKLKLGFIGGLQPELTNSNFTQNEPKFSIFAGYRTSGIQKARYELNFAFSRQYFGGEINREFFYLQNSLSFSRKLRFYQSAELDLNARDAEGKPNSLQLSNIYFSLRYKLADWIDVTTSYDARKNVRLLETYDSIPDSLFDDSFRQGLRLATRIKLTSGIHFITTTSFRGRNDSHSESLANSIGFSIPNLLHKGISTNVSYSTVGGLYSDARSLRASAGKQITNKIYATGGLENYRYKLTGRPNTISRYTAGFRMDYTLSNSFFGSVNLEQSWGDETDITRAFIEFGKRF